MPNDAVQSGGTVRTPSGTSIAYWRTEPVPSARPLLLVHGTTSDHTTWNEMLTHAGAERTTYVYDRRGRGHSGDGDTDYSLELEAVDAAVVLATMAELEGSAVDVLAHSFGAFVALAALTVDSEHVHALAAYSPGFGAAYPPGALDLVDAAIASGDTDDALRTILRDIIGMPLSEIDFMSTSPVWETRKEVAWTVPRECRADAVFLDQRSDALGRLETPVQIISGATNTPNKRAIAFRLAELIPGSTLVDLPDEGHAAHHTAPAALLCTALGYFDKIG